MYTGHPLDPESEPAQPRHARHQSPFATAQATAQAKTRAKARTSITKKAIA